MFRCTRTEDLPIETSGPFKEPLTDSMLDLGDCVTQLFGYCLTLEGFYSVGVSCSRHDNESDHSDIAASFLEAVVESWGSSN